MEQDNRLFAKMLKDNGCSLTRQRRDLFVLLRDEHHMTLASLIGRVKNQDGSSQRLPRTGYI